MSEQMSNKMIFDLLLRRLTVTLSIIIFYLGMAGLSSASSASTSHYLVREHIVVDLRSGLEWLRCSVGQVYNSGMCEGEILQLPYEDIAEAIKLANKELGGRWRLPTKNELSLLICAECPPPRIEKVIFPQTGAEPYWTGQKNWLVPKNYWSVNFMTGHSYARSFPEKPLAVRLVRDRKKVLKAE